MSKISAVINGHTVETVKGKSILEVCNDNGFEIPTFCYDERMKPHGSCRICMVEVEGSRSLVASCATPIRDGMSILTKSAKVKEARKDVLTLLVADHPLDCMKCEKVGNCKLQEYCYEYGVDENYFGQKTLKDFQKDIDDSNPFFVLDRNKCILCSKCVRMCNDLQCSGILNISNRGHKAVISTAYLDDLEDTPCVSCGNCVSVCPTGALTIKKREPYRNWEEKRTTTTCSYCGVGCQMDLCVVNNKVVDVEPKLGKANNGLLCVKGKFGYSFLSHPDRLKTPLIRKNGVLEEATWEEAYSYIKNKAEQIKKETGDYRFASLASARCTNEENYLIQKLTRAAFKTNDIDHCARLCHSSTVAGLATTLGSGAMTNSTEEILNSELVFIIGSNTTETHPVIAAHIKQALKNGCKLIVADPRKIDIAKDADIYMQIKPGSNIAIINAMIKVIYDEGLENKEFINERTENYEALAEMFENFDFSEACRICGVEEETVKKAARLYAKAKTAGIYYAMGVTQFASGTNGVMSISNLALMCGQLGKESSGVNPLRGQNNVQGSCDMGCLPNNYTSYQKVTDLDMKHKFEKAWGVTGLSDKIGKTLTEIMDAASNRDIRFMYIVGENPVVSDPDTAHIEHSLKSLDLLVVQDIFLNETTEFADVVLPATAFAEKDGTFTNTERRVQRVRKAIDAPGKAKQDWIIVQDLLNLFGIESNYKISEDIFEEMRTLTPSYGGITYDRIDNLEGLQWPCPTEDHLGTKFLHSGKFTRGKGLFVPVRYTSPIEVPDEKYPLYMTTGRNLYQYHTRTMTGKVEGLNIKEGIGYVEINPLTAEELDINNGEHVKITSPRGEIVAKARILDTIQVGLIFLPFHYAEASANNLTSSDDKTLDPTCKIPELKVSKVRIDKIDLIEDILFDVIESLD